MLNIGHLYTVTTGDSLSNIARRFGTSVESLAFLNYEVGVMNNTDIGIGKDICMIANSCFGEVQSVWDQNPKGSNALDVWYEGVQSAYTALRKAKADQLQQQQTMGVSGMIARKLLQAGGAGKGLHQQKIEEIEVTLAKLLEGGAVRGR